MHTGRIVPVYEEAGTVTAKMQRRLVHEALRAAAAGPADPLPAWMREAYGPARRGARADRDAHFPPEDASLDALNAFRTPAQAADLRGVLPVPARARCCGAAAPRPSASRIVAVVDDRMRERARGGAAVRADGGPAAALKEIVDDMPRPQPMNRLLQGDVGAGKTIVALLAALVAMENGLQVAFMAPTEILAEQHFLTIRRLLEASRFRVGAADRARRRRPSAGAVLAELATGDDAPRGRHARAGAGAASRSARSASSIIDEQHRFGVLQRATLRAKGCSPTCW